MINNLKKVISTAAALAIVASSASALAATFPDVDQSASYASSVDILTGLGIVEGDENGKFNPDNNVTRAEFAKMVVEARGEGAVAQSQTVTNFTDSVGHWAVGYIAQGVSDGFINGYDDTTFGPDDTVTYAQAVKMLVCAIGYDSFATRAGGWPTGYLSYGNSLGVTDGVAGSVTNDTALTRAQCAMLIANTLDVPLVMVTGVEYGGLTGTVPIDKTEVMDGQAGDWQTLLTKYHNAYVVKGRVENTSRTLSSLDDNQVQFKIESADNFNDTYVVKTDPITQEMYVGTTNAANMLFTYSEAIVQKDTDSDEYTLIAISQYGANKTQEVKTALISDEESYSYSMITEAKIPVYKSETSTSVTAYKLASQKNNGTDVQLYVNGVKLDNVDDETAAAYLLNSNNATGTVTLIDATETGSTSTDGYYEYILVDYYVDAVIDSVSETSTYNRIYFKNNDVAIKGSRLQWDPEDENVSVKFLKDDAEVAVKDLAEDTVLSIAYDVTGAFADSEFYEALVSTNTVSGTVTSRDASEGIVKIDGNEYEGANYIDAGALELSTEYTLYLDVFGYIANYEEGVASKNYAIIVGMYKSAGEDYATVRMITPESGTPVTKVCKDENEEDNFFTVFNGKDPEGKDGVIAYDGGSYTKTDIAAVQNNVCTYTTTSSGVKFKEYLAPKGGAELEYKASSNKLGSYTLSETASAIVDIDGYMRGDNSAGIMALSSFENEAEYEAYVYGDKASDGSYRFVIVVSGTSSINPDTAVAVVQTNPQQTVDEDGNEYISVNVARDGQDNVTVLFEDTEAESLSEGDIIVYTLQSDGTVGSYNKIFTAKSDYDALANSVYEKTNFAEALNASAFKDLSVDNTWFVSTDSKPAEAYFGPVYQKQNNSLEVFVGQSGNQSSILSNIEEFTVDSSTKSYVYDYSQRTGKGERVYAGQLSSSSASVYKGTYADADENVVDWNTVLADQITPNFAFVKVVDGDATEVVYFLAK